jgi:mannosyltransferase
MAITGLAFFLRVYRLADNNIWWDEGWTIWLSRHDLAWIALRTASDEHPPLHYWLMHFWDLVMGGDAAALAPTQGQAFAGRFFSVFFGLLTVALLYRIGRRIGGNILGLTAALLLGLARFHVWWSQDIKNYTLSGFFALASVWFVLLFVASQTNRRERQDRKDPKVFSPKFLASFAPFAVLIGYVVSITLALYSHYLATLIFLADNLFVLAVLLREWRAGGGGQSLEGGQARRVAPTVEWIIAQVAVLALYAPWLVLYLQNAATWAAAPPFDFGLFLRLAATVFALGVTTYIENYTWVVLGFTLLAALSAGWLIVRGARWEGRAGEGSRHSSAAGDSPLAPHSSPYLPGGTFFALVIVLVPAILIYMLSLTPAAVFAPKIQARYLLILLPAYMLLVALGLLLVARFSEYLAVVVLVLIAAVQVFTLSDYYHDRVLRDDYFTLVNVINSFGLPGDGVVLDTDQEWPTFLYYLHQPLPWVGVPNGAAVDDAAARRVAAQAEQYRAAWVVTIPDALVQDPGHLVEAELARHWAKEYDQTFGDKRLTLYASQVRNVKDVPPGNFAPQFARPTPFDGRLTLGGYDLPVREAQPGDAVRAVTYWASQDLANVRIELQRPDGATIAGQTIPISIGAHERAEADLVIPPDTPAAELAIVVRARLAQVQIGSVSVLPRGLETTAATLTRALDYRLGESIHLVGEDLPRTQFSAGANSNGPAVPLTLFWKTDGALATSYTAFVHLLGAQYNPAQANFLWGQIDRIPVEGRLPTSAWPAGQLIADPYAIPIQANAPPGLYKIEVGLYDAATGTRLRVFDSNARDVGDAVVVGEIEIR